MLSQVNSPLVTFDANSFALICNSGALSTATSHLLDFIPNTYRKLSGVTISGIASGLKAAGIGSVLCKYKSNSGQLIDLQIDRVLHLPSLPCRLLSPEQILKQHFQLEMVSIWTRTIQRS